VYDCLKNQEQGFVGSRDATKSLPLPERTNHRNIA